MEEIGVGRPATSTSRSAVGVRAAWIRVPPQILPVLAANELSFRAGLPAASHALLNTMPSKRIPSSGHPSLWSHSIQPHPWLHYLRCCKTPQRVFLRRSGADICYTRANKIQGLSVPTRPEGSVFMMVKLDLTVFEDMKFRISSSPARYSYAKSLIFLC